MVQNVEIVAVQIGYLEIMDIVAQDVLEHVINSYVFCSIHRIRYVGIQ